MTICEPMAREARKAISAALLERVHGEVLDRTHPQYDVARRVWNGLIDRRPAVTDPVFDATAPNWARKSWTAQHQFSTGGVYVNFAGLDTDTQRAAVYGANAQRLHDIRRAHDTNGVLIDTAARN